MKHMMINCLASYAIHMVKLVTLQYCVHITMKSRPVVKQGQFGGVKELSVQQCIHIVHTFNIVNRGNGRCNSMQAYSLPADVEERAYNVVGRDVAIPADLTK